MNKPIKRHPAIAELSKDHHFGLLLVWKIRQGFKKSVTTERISNYVLHFFNSVLKDHFKQEEEYLFNTLSQDNPLKIQVIKEHEMIYELVRLITANPNESSHISEFADILEKHIRFEERKVFNFIQDNLSEQELLKIQKALEKSGPIIDPEWSDAFWERS